jgi:hypothetical protein
VGNRGCASGDYGSDKGSNLIFAQRESYILHNKNSNYCTTKILNFAQLENAYIFVLKLDGYL